MKGFCVLLIIAAVAGAALPAAAGEDFALTYRGRITAQHEIPAELEVTYSLYVGEDDARPAWSQTKTEHPAANGAFQSVLSGAGLQAAFEDDKARFLGIRLGGTNAVEQHPRQEIIATPLAGFADAVEMASSSPEFVNAKVERLEAATLSVGTLVVTNLLALPYQGSVRMEGVALDDGARLTIQKPSHGAVQLFEELGWPQQVDFPLSDGQSCVEAGTTLFPATAKGGLVYAITADSTLWNTDYAAPCILWPVGPGAVTAPVKILRPVRFYFYEFGN